MQQQEHLAMEPLAEHEYDASGGWEPQNGMQWLGAKAHEAWNHFWAAVEESQKACSEAGSTCHMMS